MGRQIIILPAAENDIDTGEGFYEEQSVGLGAYFLDCLAVDVESLLISAGVHRRMYGYHRCVSKSFPFAISYRVDEDTISIYAVLACRRDPREIRRQLRGR